ncbi:hypothetical protein LKL35_30715 [Streptomyces sp. ET3-23]|uniref:hypothetical protein n=1 Tax=Streptomyces sp. ET3-23 TaxID=2885643 RepID=UPI001D100C7F|nr:hypothetical protein [Streptomyces sp. ET3-23]MCC2279768.1 hypothetical protein [Streptomyces sp. ET3-23]
MSASFVERMVDENGRGRRSPLREQHGTGLEKKVCAGFAAAWSVAAAAFAVEALLSSCSSL